LWAMFFRKKWSVWAEFARMLVLVHSISFCRE
jgi:hypothetical protein